MRGYSHIRTLHTANRADLQCLSLSDHRASFAAPALCHKTRPCFNGRNPQKCTRPWNPVPRPVRMSQLQLGASLSALGSRRLAPRRCKKCSSARWLSVAASCWWASLACRQAPVATDFSSCLAAVATQTRLSSSLAIKLGLPAIFPGTAASLRWRCGRCLHSFLLWPWPRNGP